MAPEAIARRYFALLVLLLIAAAAWLQARGIGALFGARLAPSGLTPVSSAPAARSSPVARSDAGSILRRNPFDSVTGPLGASAPREVPGSIAPTGTDPLSAPACADVEVRIVTEADDPRQSTAALRAGNEPSARIYRVGDVVAGRKIAYIGFNRARRSPAVWLADASGLCQALLFSQATPAASSHVDSAPVRPQP